MLKIFSIIWKILRKFGSMLLNNKYHPAKNLLLVLNTLPKGVEINKLRDAFNSYQQDQSKKYGYIIKKNDFNNSLKDWMVLLS